MKKLRYEQYCMSSLNYNEKFSDVTTEACHPSTITQGIKILPILHVIYPTLLLLASCIFLKIKVSSLQKFKLNISSMVE